MASLALPVSPCLGRARIRHVLFGPAPAQAWAIFRLRMSPHNGMVTYSGHLKRVLLQVLESHDVLADVKNIPLDIDGIKREMLRINGSLKAVLSSVPESSITHSDYKALRAKFAAYLDSYDFEGELDAMYMLYAEDVMRINNVRAKILEALEDKGMMKSTMEMVEQL